MTNILVAFPKLENGRSIKSILVRSGYTVNAVCTSGAQALQYIEEWDSGIIISGYAFPDMNYEELFHCLRPEFQMLVVTSSQRCGEISKENLLYLPMPFKGNELLETVELMVRDFMRTRRRMKSQPKKRSDADQKVIDTVKRLLMERNHMTESEAHRYLQKTSMDSGNSLVETAQMVLCIMEQG